MIDSFDGYDRVKAIQALIADDKISYDNFTDEQIIEQLEDRDISYLFGDDDDDYDGQPDEAQEWYDFDPDA
jgi:hypothetical protein